MGNVLAYIFPSFVSLRDSKLLMVGLDGAGKTTILYRLQLGEVVSTAPTVGFYVESLTYKKLRITVWDVGGQDKVRSLWKRYFKGTDGIVYVVDSAAPNRLQESKEELWKILNDEELTGAKLLIYANKQDDASAIPINKLTEAFDLYQIKDRQWFIQSTCAIQGTGLYEGLDWLSNALLSSK